MKLKVKKNGTFQEVVLKGMQGEKGEKGDTPSITHLEDYVYSQMDSVNNSVDEKLIDIQADYDTLKGGLLATDKVVYFQDEINKTNSSLETIVNFIDNPNIVPLGENEYKLTADITLTKSLMVNSNTILRGCGKTITSNFDGVVINAQGKNITIDGLKIDCNNKACTGILVNTNSTKVNITNNEVFNSYGGNTKPVYGIFVSAIGCNDINVKNNDVHDIKSLDDGVIAQRDGGWAKGIIVDLYDVITERPTTDSIISTNITIENNTVENIQDVSDADGIYLEGYKSSKINNYKVINNFLKNCGKRFIKVMNCGNVDISGNYGINDYNNMHSFISLYSGNCTVKNNTMLVINDKYTRYGVEIGYQAKYEDVAVKDIIIEDNKFSISTIVDYGNVIARPLYDGKLANVKIKNNELIGGAETINFTDGASVEKLEIVGNTLRDNVTNKSSIKVSNVSVNNIIIENNRSIGTFSNAYVVRNLVQGNLTIKNNIIDKANNSVMVVDNFDIVQIENNTINTTTSATTLTNVNNNIIKNNLDIRTKTTDNATLYPFKIQSISTSTFDIDASIFTQICTLKLIPSVASTLNSLTGTNGQIINIVASNTTGVTLSHSTSLHLKGSTNVTLNVAEQCLTIVKMDNRWIEISRNF